jgi:hypothetical protein
LGEALLAAFGLIHPVAPNYSKKLADGKLAWRVGE